MRALRLALDSRRVRRVVCVVCACTAIAPLAMVAASNTAVAHFTLTLKPNINDYSCTSLALLWWNSKAAGAKPTGPSLIRTSAALYERPLPLVSVVFSTKGETQDGEKEQQRRFRQNLSRLSARRSGRCGWTVCVSQVRISAS